METPTIPAQGAEGQEVQTTAPQAAETSAKPDSQAQEASRVQVEDNGQSSSTETPERSSDVETARWIKRLERQIRSLQQVIERNQQAQPQGDKGTQRQRYKPSNEDWKNPENVIERMVQDRVQDVIDTIPQTLAERQAAMALESSKQEALKLIETNDAVKRDPQGIERIQEILLEEKFGLNKMSAHFPMEAAHAALEIYNARYRPGKSSSAPSKAQMVSTAAAAVPGAGKTTTESEAQALMAEAIALGNSKDPEFMRKLNAFVAKADREDRLRSVKK